MKFIKTSFCALALLMATTMMGQKNVEVKKSVIEKTFNVEKDGTKFPYRVKVYNSVKSQVVLKDEDKNKLNQSRKEVADYVSKFIYVDNDTDDAFDKYIVMRYWKDNSDTFELVPTAKGFKVVVDGKYVEYIFGEGFYQVDSPDKDFFMIDQFDPIVSL